MKIYCCACEAEVFPQLITGDRIYPHRPDLSTLNFWRCDCCFGYVGCHGKGTKPLGNIPTPALRDARKKIHAIMDPLWKQKGMARSDVYRELAKVLGRPYHTAEIRSIEEARVVYAAVRNIANGG